MEKVWERNKKFQTKESELKGREFTPRPSDVFIATYPKCGTTWVTQILHSLRSRGHMDFVEITQVVPWDVLALDCGQDLDQDQLFEPRLFKSHETFEDIAKNEKQFARYIHVARNPEDAFISFYNFLPPYFGVSLDEVTIDKFWDALFSGVSNSGTMAHFYLGWFEALKKHPDNILWIFYEDLKSDLEGSIKKMADWLGMDTTDDELLKIALNNSSFKFMKEHVGQFDDGFVFNHRKEAMGMSDQDGPLTPKVRQGTTGSSDQMTESVRQKLKTAWKDVIEKQLGFANYDELKAAVDKLQN